MLRDDDSSFSYNGPTDRDRDRDRGQSTIHYKTITRSYIIVPPYYTAAECRNH